MTEVQTQTTKTKRTVGLVVAAVVLIGGVVFGAVQLSGGGTDSPAPSGTAGQTDDGGDMRVGGGDVLPKPMGGQQAIDAMGEDIVAVAAKNDMTVEELEALLLKDASAQIAKNGLIMYKEPTP